MKHRDKMKWIMAILLFCALIATMLVGNQWLSYERIFEQGEFGEACLEELEKLPLTSGQVRGIKRLAGASQLREFQEDIFSSIGQIGKNAIYDFCCRGIGLLLVVFIYKKVLKGNEDDSEPEQQKEAEIW